MILTSENYEGEEPAGEDKKGCGNRVGGYEAV